MPYVLGMRSRWFRWACGLLVVLALAPLKVDAQSTDARVLRADNPAFELSGTVQAWLEPAQNATVQEVSQRPMRFTAHSSDRTYPLSADTTLWIRLTLARAPGTTDAWLLDTPIPFLDAVSLFQRDANGQWQEQKSGDTLAHRDWSVHSLTPAFALRWQGSQEQVVYLRVRNLAPAFVPLRLSTQSAFDARQTTEILSLGLLCGALLALVIIGVLRSVEQDWVTWRAAILYALLACTTIAQANGLLGMTLWQDLPILANYGSKLIATITVGGTLLYMRKLYALSVHYHRFDRLLGFMGITAMAVAIALVGLAPQLANLIESAVYVMATAVLLVSALLSWRGGSPIWYWLAAATVPQSLCVLWLAAEYSGLVLPQWELRYITSGLLALSVPVLAHALRKMTYDRQEQRHRTQQLGTQDALTGLLKREVFELQIVDALLRVRQNQESVALVVVSLINHAHIASTLGSNMGEQCELRAVVKLHRVLRDVDPAARIAAGRYALLLEGVRNRDQLNERMVQLIASGLTPLPGLLPEIALQFQAACVLLHEQPLDAADALDTLEDLLSTMSPGTRRPIRHIESPETVPYEAPESV